MGYQYSMQADRENTAKALGSGLGISRKHGIEICNYIRGKPVVKAKQLLEEVIAEKRHVPFKRFTAGAGHRKGIEKGPGKYPIKACEAILGIVKLAEANAQFKGLNTDSLVIKHISCQQAPSNYRPGRHRGRKTKTAHIEVIVEETEKKKVEKKKAKKMEVKGEKEAKEPEEKPAEAPKEDKPVEEVKESSGEAPKEDKPVEEVKESSGEAPKEVKEVKKELTEKSSAEAKEQKQPKEAVGEKTATQLESKPESQPVEKTAAKPKAKPKAPPAPAKKEAKLETEQQKVEKKTKAAPAKEENQLK